MHQPRRYPNPKAGVEAVIQLLLEPVGRQQRQKLIELLSARTHDQ